MFDGAALVRSCSRRGALLTLAVDCAFSLACAVLLAAVWLRVNYLDFRMYALMGAAAGAVLYALTVRPLMVRLVARPLIFLWRRVRRMAGSKIFRKIFR